MYKKTRRLNCFSIISLSYGLFYGLVPFLYLTFKYSYYSTSYMQSISYASEYRFLYVSIICLTLYILFLFVNIPTHKHIINLEDVKNIVELKVYADLRKQIYNFLMLSGYVLMLIGGLSIVIIIINIGGIYEFIRMSAITRGFGHDASRFINSNLLFLITLMPAILASTYLFFTARSIKKNRISLIFFVFSFVLSILYLLSNGGRAPLIMFLLPFFLVGTRGNFLGRLVVFFILSIPTLIYLDKLFYYLEFGQEMESEEINSLFYFIEQFGYPYANLINSDTMVEVFGFRYGVDLFTWVINIAPSYFLKLIGLSKVDPISTPLTLYYADIMNTRVNGGVPVDLLTLGYLQFHFPGMLIVTLLFAFLVKKIDNHINRLYIFKEYHLITNRIILMLIFFIPNSNLDAFIRNRFDIILLILILFYISHKKMTTIKANTIRNKE
jgi:oligosaccharide repeat unit polymerase